MNDRLILLVEHNPAKSDSMLLALQQSEIVHRVVVTRDGIEALEYLYRTGRYSARDASIPQMILLDLNLPRLGGLEVLDSVRTNPDTALIPVVMLTSSREQEDRIPRYPNGASRFVRKPLALQAFAAAVRSLGIHRLPLHAQVAEGSRP